MRQRGAEAISDAAKAGRHRLRSGDLPPRILTPPPGPRARALSRRLAAAEAPGVNTLAGDAPNLLWQEARGANVLDVDGNRYLDLTSGFGVAAIGHRHPRVVAAVRRQAGRLLHGLGDVHAHPLRVALGERLTALAPVGEPGEPAQVYFATSGAEAVEIAVKTAILATGRPAVAAFAPAYHGLTFGALSLTTRAEFRDPFAAHLHARVHRLAHGGPASELAAALAGGDVACVVVEPVVGREGVVFPPAGWLAEVAAACRRAGTLLVADEVFTGFGRTGHLFAVEAEGVRPDLLVCGKALGGGLPIAAVLAPARRLAAWRCPGEALHTSTFLANPLSCAAALAVLDVLAADRLVERARRLEPRVRRQLGDWPRRFPAVAAVRGRGLLWGIEMTGREAASRLVVAARARGVLLLAGGPQGRVAQVVPPLGISERRLDQALELLAAACADSGPAGGR
ncbi:MAG TPA: aminotransferase class III-fold pyridoxal phosphate-dependent enzyme [Thermoanaerobaculia bacterium]|nr:aminotransferase class III-fold pyridoxal phosphate-dependent enzyme [Thermoanaerobaculia bacterium]